ncbi:PREDICTED: serine/threonine-protein kinase Nek2-like [Amphimedon queenslandica]|uniref:non-specific serine/threonine protein kinase n=1 Tax=Amphimedon queenslandica TaxID=400682 RepID=A0A1X7ULK1_AMPQE|nr:PREDICTED: serine/threonine-protein kinase Nek2-like [Amphimedon queenslandica]|eukprot:XP_011404763.1 PREDICTED: serine/threonine-protein kinase Nek2-like [Amphimedon queenslandica]
MPSGKLDDYVVVGMIGSGSFGQCKKIRRICDGKVLVWKEINYKEMTESEKQQLVTEVNLLRELKHTHIVQYYDRIIDRSQSMLYIITEYCPGGDLATLISQHRHQRKLLPECFIWQVMHQILLALEECHRSKENVGGKVMHRDIKPANVFLDGEGQVKLGDFGLARILHNTSLAKTFVGTPYYMSPEQYSCNSYDHRSDLWSIGCLLYELCALKPPFVASSQYKLAEYVCNGRFSRIPSKYSDDLHWTISQLLHVKPEKRPLLSQLLSLLEEKIPLAKPPNVAGTEKTTPPSVLGAVKEEESLQRKLDELHRKEEILRKKEEDLQRKEIELKRREEVLVLREKQQAILK